MSETAPQSTSVEFESPHFKEVEDVTWKAVEDFWEDADQYLDSEPDPMVIEIEDGKTKEFSVIDAVNITSEEKWDPESKTFVKRSKDEMGRHIILEAEDGEKIEMPVNAYLWETFGDTEDRDALEGEKEEPSELDKLEGALEEFLGQFSDEEVTNMWKVTYQDDGNALNSLSPNARKNLSTYEKLMHDLNEQRRRHLDIN